MRGHVSPRSESATRASGVLAGAAGEPEVRLLERRPRDARARRAARRGRRAASPPGRRACPRPRPARDRSSITVAPAFARTVIAVVASAVRSRPGRPTRRRAARPPRRRRAGGRGRSRSGGRRSPSSSLIRWLDTKHGAPLGGERAQRSRASTGSPPGRGRSSARRGSGSAGRRAAPPRRRAAAASRARTPRAAARDVRRARRARAPRPRAAGGIPLLCASQRGGCAPTGSGWTAPASRSAPTRVSGRASRRVGPAVDERLAGVGVGEAEQQLHRRRLACAVRPDEPRDAAGPDGEREVVDRDRAAVALRQAAGLDGRRPCSRRYERPASRRVARERCLRAATRR